MSESLSRHDVISLLTAGYQKLNPKLSHDAAKHQAEHAYESVRMAAYFKGTEAGENVAIAGSAARLRAIPLDLLMPPGFYEGIQHAAKVVESWPTNKDENDG